MPMFRYKAVSPGGKRLSGLMEAPDEYTVVARLKESDAVLTKISRARDAEERHKKKSSVNISEKSLSVMCTQFAIILGSGLPIVRAVELIAAQTPDKTLKNILTQAAGDVRAGFGLAVSLHNRSQALPVTFVETIRSGEESGTLDIAFRRLASYYDKSFKIKSGVKAAMVYPIFTIVVAIIVLIIIMVVAVPAFTASFSAMGVQLPLATRILIGMSSFFSNYWHYLGVVLLCLWLMVRTYLKTEKGALAADGKKLRLPVLGKIGLMKSSAQFANTLSTLLSAGLPVLRAATVTASVIDNRWISAAISRQLYAIQEGKTLSDCLRAAGVLPQMLCEMTRIGEETGALESTLTVVGEYYDSETEFASKKALALLEPIIICLLAGFVLFILLSVYLPMFSLYSNIG